MIEFAFDPVIVQLGTFQLTWHGIFTALALVAALWVVSMQAARLGLDEAALTPVIVWGFVGGIIGARLFHVLDHLPDYADQPLRALAVWEGGIAVYGSFIGGIVGGVIAARLRRLPVWQLLDVAAPAMLVGQMVGRLGCLSNGDAWGAPTGGNYGIVYSHPNALVPPSLLGVPTHPYPLYEIVLAAALLGLLWLLRDRLDRPGMRFLVAAIGYGAIRFGLSYFRQEAVIFAGLQEAQLIGLVTALLAAGLLVWRASAQPATRREAGVS